MFGKSGIAFVAHRDRSIDLSALGAALTGLAVRRVVPPPAGADEILLPPAVLGANVSGLVDALPKALLAAPGTVVCNMAGFPAIPGVTR